MLYLNEQHVRELGLNWDQLIQVIGDATKALESKDFSQPIKPYLRFNDPKNRIIAMPAYVGNDINMAGIKWIASFPDNTNRGLNRANSITILNSPHTGVPVCIINTSFISAIRTAAVSGYIIKKYLTSRSQILNVGIVGFGPIGKLHLKMIESLLNGRINQVRVYDINPSNTKDLSDYSTKIVAVDSWEQAYSNADIFITSTVSKATYIGQPPKQGSLHLNISLRDYKPEFRNYADWIIVDNWEEVCRENTDIENMSKYMGLTKGETYSIIDVEKGDLFEKIQDNEVVMFNPMGMAVYDISIGNYYFNEAILKNIGIVLEG